MGLHDCFITLQVISSAESAEQHQKKIWLELARHTVFLNRKCENYCVVCLSDVKGCGFFFSPLLDSCYSIYIPGDHQWCSFPWTYISIPDRIGSSSFRLLCTLDFVLHLLPFGMHWIPMHKVFVEPLKTLTNHCRIKNKISTLIKNSILVYWILIWLWS